jgi:hypothetical protein
MPLVILVVSLCLSACTLARATVTVVNQGPLRVHRLHLQTPDSEHTAFGLASGGRFTFHRVDCSFRQPWRYEAELDDGSRISGDSGSHHRLAEVIEIRVLGDGRFETVAIHPAERGP